MSIKVMNNIKMLCYDMLDVSEGIDLKTNASKECNICQYKFFLK